MPVPIQVKMRFTDATTEIVHAGTGGNKLGPGA